MYTGNLFHCLSRVFDNFLETPHFQGDFIWQEVWRTSINLFEVRWNDHLVNYFYLMYRGGINTNLLHLTLFFTDLQKITEVNETWLLPYFWSFKYHCGDDVSNRPLYISNSRSSRPEVFCKKGVLIISQNSQEAGNFIKKRLWHRCFPVNFAKFVRTPFLTEHLWWLLLKFTFLPFYYTLHNF